MVSEPCRLCFIASCTRMEEGGSELRDPHITKCRVWQGVGIVGRSLGNQPLSLRVCCGVVGTLCRGHTERQVAASRATRASGHVRGRTPSWVGEDVTPLANG
ncbi:hypothetical protein HAX54_015693, partial [Datura stramonium]|nr:hypothetical protein [Datura stramonium]